jgi:putative addiction module component (TIGR02574 family)
MPLWAFLAKRIPEMDAETILKEALALKPNLKAKLVDQLLLSLDEPGKEHDDRWAEEVEDRIDAYERGEIKAVSLEDVLAKYR